MEELFIINEKEEEYRFNNVSGPKYLLRGPRSDFGLVVLMPGEDFPTHYHHEVEENFYTLEGEAEIYIFDKVFTLRPGDLLHVPPYHPHYLINRGKVPWKAVFAKSPYNPKDKYDLKWKPGDPPMRIEKP
ncbi:MAG: cupin domain-containing protein [Anaerolineae bacterium]|jgi:mannose-6-phosphate isomerase-like protein (cupin superfamily)|nr:MAG: cupin domain-containing protein [Anaerolineae bacterium]